MSASELDPRVILESLGIDEISSIDPVSGGYDAALWRVEHGPGELVSALRVLPAGREFSARLEVAAMRLAATGGVPVPAIRAEGSWRGWPAQLMAWCPSTALGNALESAPDEAEALGLRFGETQGRIHAIEVPDDPSATVLERDWIARIGSSEVALQARLRAQPSRRCLLHCDFHPLNIMVDNGAISGVLDWSNACAGDPRVDLARTQSILRLVAIRPSLLSDAGLEALESFASGWRAGYEAVAGPPGEMTLFDAWAAVYLIEDLGPKLGQRGVWLTPEHLEQLRHDAAAAKERAGIG